MRVRSVVTACLAVVLGIAAGVVAATGTAAAAGPRPAFQLPFPCGQTWHGNSSNSSAHRSYEIDFNRGDDLGDPVLAAAAGKVVISSHQGSVNGYGNLVKIDHGDGWYTYYAHLRVRSVTVGQRVAGGQKIGEVGNTSSPGNNISPHLHYEVRTDGSYPGNIQPAYFDGERFPYPDANITSRNACDGTTNPYGPTDVCGDGYGVIDSASLGTAATVYLLYDGSTGRNCVATIKNSGVGTESALSAYLEVEGASRVTDSGQYAYYAGPVRAEAASTCVRWGGSAGSASYDSPLEHCG
ncbi:peptidase M23-like protein [Prauserella shujinwangii]|uniref:Peptidase M23-like protein n=1 Tax=Prauserella shujinwangii TaxID=1453103 RepID=A0A2T0LYZ5_9PSEU|nr:M23 family metallopeptidase [Prauserella shujinwangii]PRX49341.1 peptidase M23-like protein [Prauserella shujinwangii]